MKKQVNKKASKKVNKKASKKVVSNITLQDNRLAFAVLKRRANQRTRLAVKKQEEVVKTVADVFEKSEYVTYHRKVTQAELIDKMLAQSATMYEIVKALLLSDVKIATEKKVVVRRIKSHIRHLRDKHGVVVNLSTEDKRYLIA